MRKDNSEKKSLEKYLAGKAGGRTSAFLYNEVGSFQLFQKKIE